MELYQPERFLKPGNVAGAIDEAQNTALDGRQSTLDHKISQRLLAKQNKSRKVDFIAGNAAEARLRSLNGVQPC